MSKYPPQGIFVTPVERVIASTAPFHEGGQPVWHCPMGFLFRSEELVAESRGDGPRDQERCKERDRDGDCQGNQQQTRDTNDEKHGQKDHHRRHRRCQNRHGHFSGGSENTVPAAGVGIEVPLDVFQFHDGVINESTNAESKSSEREDVQRLSCEIEHDKGDEHGERNGDGDDHGARQVAQKNEDHCCGQ